MGANQSVQETAGTFRFPSFVGSAPPIETHDSTNPYSDRIEPGPRRPMLIQPIQRGCAVAESVTACSAPKRLSPYRVVPVTELCTPWDTEDPSHRSRQVLTTIVPVSGRVAPISKNRTATAAALPPTSPNQPPPAVKLNTWM